jgi:hypothetical protein
LGLVSPAFSATFTNCTGDVVGAETAASTRSRFLHCHRGVARASVSVPPNMKRDEPRKRLRGKIIDCSDYRIEPATSQRVEVLNGFVVEMTTSYGPKARMRDVTGFYTVRIFKAVAA